MNPYRESGWTPPNRGTLEIASGDYLDRISESLLRGTVRRMEGEPDSEYRDRVRSAIDGHVTAGTLAEFMEKAREDDRHLQRANDAELVAEGWRNTAARWRRRFMRGTCAWKREATDLKKELNLSREKLVESDRIIEMLLKGAAP